MKNLSRWFLVSKLSVCFLIYMLLTARYVHTQMEVIPEERTTSAHDEKKAPIDRLQFFRRWCRCRRRRVRHRRYCRCPKPPKITPFPTIPPPEPTPSPLPTPLTKSWGCQCNGTVVEAETEDECTAKPERCRLLFRRLPPLAETVIILRCDCLNKSVRNRKKCCKCEEEKCKCWSKWWKNWKRYGGHRAFKLCGKVCRRRKC